MDYKDVIAGKGRKTRLDAVNEQIEYLSRRYDDKTAAQIIASKLNEEGEQQPAQQGQQPAAPAAPAQQGGEQPQAPAQPAQQGQQPAQPQNLNAEIIKEYQPLGKQFQEFAKKYQNTEYKDDINNILKLMGALYQKVQSGAKQPAQQQPAQQPAQQGQQPAQQPAQ